MPTHEETPTFLRDYGRLTNTQEKRLEAALSQFIADLRAIEAGEQAWFRPGLRVKRVRGVAGLYEMTWAPDGRATFSWGQPLRVGTRHVVWHRCGDHSILP